MGILDKIVESKKKYLAEIKKSRPLPELKARCEKRERRCFDFGAALRVPGGISVIAEVKKASPSKGLIRPDFNHLEIAREYFKAGVNALSVLTETEFFLGKPEYLSEIREISQIPLLRKDFITDEYQIYEAYLLGADAILLIAAILSENELKYFRETAHSLGMKCLAEAHDEKEAEKILNAGFEIIGINNRNLQTFNVDLETTARLAEKIPPEKTIVSESGIKDARDIEYLKKSGVSAVLIGETFMRAENIAKTVRNLINN